VVHVSQVIANLVLLRAIFEAFATLLMSLPAPSMVLQPAMNATANTAAIIFRTMMISFSRWKNDCTRSVAIGVPEHAKPTSTGNVTPAPQSYVFSMGAANRPLQQTCDSM
jgi:hypothetical protein